jgi:hypothetical protein
MNGYKPESEISTALEKLLKGKITLGQYNKIVQMYKPTQE